MKIYRMVRDEDVSGVSGTGIVGEVVEFSDGTATVRWLTEYRSTVVYASVEDAIRIHGQRGPLKPSRMPEEDTGLGLEC